MGQPRCHGAHPEDLTVEEVASDFIFHAEELRRVGLWERFALHHKDLLDELRRKLL